MELIQFKNVFKQYKNGVTALCDINLEIAKGEFVFVIGGSGSGKSSLIKLIYREELPSKGEVFVGGINVAKLRNGKVYKLRRKLGIVFQDYKLLDNLTVYENVAIVLKMLGIKDKEEISEAIWLNVDEIFIRDDIHNYTKAIVEAAVKSGGLYMSETPILNHLKNEFELFFSKNK